MRGNLSTEKQNKPSYYSRFFPAGKEHLLLFFCIECNQSNRNRPRGRYENGTEKFCGAVRGGALLLAVCAGLWHGTGGGAASCGPAGGKNSQNRL